MGQARDEAGNIWETDAQGNPTRLLQAAGAPDGQVFSLPPDQAEQARIDMARNADARAQSQAGLRESLLRAQIAKAEADAAKAAQGTAGAQVGDAKLQSRLANINALVEQINRVQQLYEGGPGATEGFPGSLSDYFPSESNRQFDTAAAGLAEQGLAAFRVPGVGAQSDTELRQFVQANRPAASDFDVEIEEKLRQLRQRVDSTRQAMGIAPAQWRTAPAAADEQQNRNPFNTIRMGNPDGNSAAPGGATQGNTVTVPPEMNAEKDALVAQLMQQGGGRIDPDAYAQGMAAIVAKYPDFGITPESSAQWARDINGYLDSGGKTVPSGLKLQDRPLSQQEQNRNNLISNPIGATAASFADMGGFGGVSAFAPDQMSALGDAHPVATTLGQIGGAITGTAALGKLGAETLGRAAPQLLQGGRAAQFGRNVATDVGYGGIYGGASEGDPLSGAALAGLGSVGGQGLGKLAGRAIGGVNLTPAVEALRARGIPMTVPQQLGGWIKTVEDKAMSMPLVSDMIRARRVEGLNAFNREAFNEAGAPIGATVRDNGQEGIRQLSDQVSDAYNNATRGASVQFDQQFGADFGQAVANGQRLPPDLRRSLGEVLDARVGPITDTGTMTGEQFQQAMRALKATRTNPPQRFQGFEQDYRNAVTGVMDSLEGQMMRGGGDNTVAGLQTANAANRNLRTIEDATNRAAGGSETGTPFMFTPSQLQRAGMKSQGQFPGPRPFAELADSGQRVLPSRVPDSGTAGRAAQMLLVPGMLGGGAGYAASGDAQGVGTGAGISTALMLTLLAGGTKGGQKALQKALIDRPVVMQQLGRQIRNRAGIFGSAALPALIADY